MSHVYTLEHETVTKLVVSVALLALLLYAAGWISAELHDKGFALFRGKPAEAPAPALEPNAARDAMPPDLNSDFLKSETAILVRELLDLRVTVPEALQTSVNVDAVPFTVLDQGLWKTRLDRALFRMQPAQFDESDDPLQGYFFSIFFETGTDAEDAARMAQMIRAKGYDPYLIPVENLADDLRYAVMLGDYDELGKALQAVRDFNRKEALPAAIVYAESLSLSSLKDLLATPPVTLPEPEPEPPVVESEPVPEIPEPMVRPYTIRLACFNTPESARRAADHYREKGLAPLVMGPTRPGGFCGWVVYTGHWTERSQARRARAGVGVSDAVVQNMPHTLLIGLYASEAEGKSLFESLEAEGAGPYWLAAGEGKVRLFSGVFRTAAEAEKWMRRLSEKDIAAEIISASDVSSGMRDNPDASYRISMVSPVIRLHPITVWR